VLRLPAVDETSRVKTFAVTIEPDGGTPAPTGSMVLAGAVS
jgi:anti-sigma-K factor RskA